ncbi:MAG: hypothetical protein NW207_04735 [Cytophagales bacterium]|nr:hypothetical protein [Cytophagales bacterium]
MDKYIEILKIMSKMSIYERQESSIIIRNAERKLKRIEKIFQDCEKHIANVNELKSEIMQDLINIRKILNEDFSHRGRRLETTADKVSFGGRLCSN